MEDSIFLSQTSDLLVMKYYFLKFKLDFYYLISYIRRI
ncbi:hypothetical protein HMPREF9406_0030 [Clostridium sp. HGF2]|nr:hypothetical protein HMPREF9406_0030 [Clostridium sp. HGF2]EQJ60091.1 hypothetical protein QSI_1276 [Clostridioides difficile P28]